jgi:ribosomal-protein-alanine N-acetyltransferase
MNNLFSSSRLLFRQFTISDAPLIYALNKDPEVIRYLHELPITDEKAALELITERILPQYKAYGYGRWAVLLKENHAFLGWCGLKYRPEIMETDLGYRFLRSCWGKGYASEAAAACISYGFSQCHLPLITARAHVENLASQRVIEKCGMQFTCFEEVDNCPVKTYQIRNPAFG